MSKRNFDKYIEERKNKRKEFALFGEKFYLPPTLSFDAVLRFKELGSRDKNETLNDLEVLDIFASIFGEVTLKRIKEIDTDNNFDIDLASELMKWALEEYGVTNKEEEVKDSPK